MNKKIAGLFILLSVNSIFLPCSFADTAETPEELVDKGVDYYNKGRFDEAIGSYKKALSLRPKHEVALFNIGLAYAQKRQWEDSIRALEDLVEIVPLNARVHYTLAGLYAEIGKYTDAFKHYEKCRELNFSEMNSEFIKQMEAFRHREYDFSYQPLLDKDNKEVIIKIKGNPQSNILFRDVIQQLESLEYVSGKGIFREIDIKFIRGQRDEAWFEEWTVKKENIENKYIIEFMANTTIGGTDFIIQQVKHSEGNVDPNVRAETAEGYIYSGKVNVITRNFDQAISDFTKAIKISPNDADAYYNRGAVYLRQGNYVQAISDVSKAIEINPNDADTYYNRGNVYFEQGNYAQAISDYTKAIEINPNDAKTYSNRGVVYFKQGNYTQAISDHTKAIEINPNDADAYYNRGSAYYAVQEYDKAWADVHKAEKLGYAVKPEFLNALKKSSGRDK